MVEAGGYEPKYLVLMPDGITDLGSADWASAATPRLD